jgi:hypothetical protein
MKTHYSKCYIPAISFVMGSCASFLQLYSIWIPCRGRLQKLLSSYFLGRNCNKLWGEVQHCPRKVWKGGVGGGGGVSSQTVNFCHYRSNMFLLLLLRKVSPCSRTVTFVLFFVLKIIWFCTVFVLNTPCSSCATLVIARSLPVSWTVIVVTLKILYAIALLFLRRFSRIVSIEYLAAARIFVFSFDKFLSTQLH